MPGLRIVGPLLALVLLVGFLTACASAGNAEVPEGMTGTVRFLNIEGGCWVIRTDDDRTLSPIDFPPSLRQDGLRVSFTAAAEPEVVTSCMAGEPVRLISIEPLPSTDNK